MVAAASTPVSLLTARSAIIVITLAAAVPVGRYLTGQWCGGSASTTTFTSALTATAVTLTDGTLGTVRGLTAAFRSRTRAHFKSHRCRPALPFAFEAFQQMVVSQLFNRVRKSTPHHSASHSVLAKQPRICVMVVHVLAREFTPTGKSIFFLASAGGGEWQVISGSDYEEV